MSRLYFGGGNNKPVNFKLNIIISAVLCALPFTFPDLFFTAWVGMVPFFSALMSDEFMATKKTKAFGIGFLCGFLYFCLIYYWFLWLYPLDFAGLSPLTAMATVLLAWFGLSAFQALYFGTATLIYRVIGKKSPLILAMLFTLCEFCWGFGQFAMPWCKISITQYKFLPAIQSSALFGSLFVSLIIYLVNSLVATKNKKYIMTAIVVFFANIFYGTVMLCLPDSYTQKAEFSLVQGNIASGEKWQNGSEYKSFEMFCDLSYRTAQKDNPDYIVWPESAVPVNMNSAYRVLFEQIPKDTGSTLIMGAFGQEEGKSSNSLFLIDQNGVNDVFYSKRHLVPFGEYLPMRSFFERYLPFVADINMLESDLYKSSNTDIIQSDNGKIGGLICFDSIFPSLARQSVMDGAELIVLITNDSWYLDSPATYQHASQAVFRAVENRRSVVRCANTGISMIIDQKGRIISQLGPLQKGVVNGSAGFSRTHTLYTYIGDILMYFIVVYILAVVIIKITKRKSEI